MKKYILLSIAILLIPVVVHAWGVMMVGGGTPSAAGGDCDFIGAYEYGYNGEYTGDDTSGCNGTAEMSGTESEGGLVTASGRTGNAINLDSDSESLSFSITDDYEYFHLLLWIYLDNSTDENMIFEAWNNSSNYVYCMATAANVVTCRHRGNSASVDITTSNATIPDSQWTQVEMIFDEAAGLPGTTEIGIRINYNGDDDFDDANEGWEYEEDGTDGQAMAASPTTLIFGEASVGNAITGIRIDDAVWSYTE